jgi:hypothetical protein
MPDVFAWLIAVSGALVALGVIWTKGVRPLWRFLRRVENVHTLIIEDLPAFMQNTVEWQANADNVLKQLQPNSGSSMFDRVKRIEQHLSLDVERRG